MPAMMRKGFLMVAMAAITTACGGSFPDRSSWPRRQFTGVAIFRMEYAEFIEGGTCDPASNDFMAPNDIWIDGKDADVVRAFHDLGVLRPPYGAALVTVEGRLSPPGQYGHLGRSHRRELFVERVVAIRHAPRCR